MSLLLEAVHPKKILWSKEFIDMKKNSLVEKTLLESRRRPWLRSFLLALGLHGALLFLGGAAFVRPPEFGIQGSRASMEIHMVAALPRSVQIPVSVMKSETSELPPSSYRSEMEVEAKKKSLPVSANQETARSRHEQEVRSASKAAGDGSAKTPGKDVTTLFSRGSAETRGKSGKYLNSPPEYPEKARQNQWQGVVWIKALIVKEGRPEKVLLEKSSGYGILDDSALRAVSGWKFTPGQLGHQTVHSWIKIPIRFILDEA